MSIDSTDHQAATTAPHWRAVCCGGPYNVVWSVNDLPFEWEKRCDMDTYRIVDFPVFVCAVGWCEWVVWGCGTTRIHTRLDVFVFWNLHLCFEICICVWKPAPPLEIFICVLKPAFAFWNLHLRFESRHLLSPSHDSSNGSTKTEIARKQWKSKAINQQHTKAKKAKKRNQVKKHSKLQLQTSHQAQNNLKLTTYSTRKQMSNMHKKTNCKKRADRLISQQYTKAKKAKKTTGQKTFKITNKSISKQFEFNHTHHKKTNVQPAQETQRAGHNREQRACPQATGKLDTQGVYS